MGITIVRRWDYFALFLLVLYFLSKSIWALPKSSNFRVKYGKSKQNLTILAIFTHFNLSSF